MSHESKSNRFAFDNYQQLPFDDLIAAYADLAPFAQWHANRWLLPTSSVTDDRTSRPDDQQQQEPAEPCWVETALASSTVASELHQCAATTHDAPSDSPQGHTPYLVYLAFAVRNTVPPLPNSNDGRRRSNTTNAGLAELRSVRSCIAALKQIESSAASASSRSSSGSACVLKGVSEKKQAEVGGMLRVIEPLLLAHREEAAADCADRGADDLMIVADVGAGQGDLVAALSAAGQRKGRRPLHVAAVERDGVQLHGSLRRRGGSGPSFAVVGMDIRSSTSPELFARQLRDETVGPPNNNASARVPPSLVLCTLHACGALSDNVLRLFADLCRRGNAAAATSSETLAVRPEAIVNLGCCYNLLALGEATKIQHAAPKADDATAKQGNRAEAAEAPSPTADVVVSGTVPTTQGRAGYHRFPQSEGLQGHFARRSDPQDSGRLPAYIGHTALTAACQSPRTWPNDPAQVFDGVFERAVAQHVLELRFGVSTAVRLRPAAAPPAGVDSDDAERFAGRYAATLLQAVNDYYRTNASPPPPAVKAHRAEGKSTPADSPTSTPTPKAINLTVVRSALQDAFVALQRCRLPFAVAWVLRAVAGEILEVLLLCDRCFHVVEASGGRCRAALAPVIPQHVSPRCLAVVAVAT